MTSIRARRDINANLHPVVSASREDALNRTKVAVVPTPAKCNVVVLRCDIVRRVEIDPAEAVDRVELNALSRGL